MAEAESKNVQPRGALNTVQKISTCHVCKSKVNQKQKALECEICEDWFHIECCNIQKKTYDSLLDDAANTFHWFCTGCNKAAVKIMARVTNLLIRTENLE